MIQTHNTKSLALSLMTITAGLVLFIFFPGGGFLSLLINFFPVSISELIMSINRIPGGDWFITGSHFIWNGNRLPYNFYNFILFEIFPSLLFLGICFSSLRFFKISPDEIGFTKLLSRWSNRSALVLGLFPGAVIFFLVVILFPKILERQWGIHLGLAWFENWRSRPFNPIFPGPIVEEFFFRGIFFIIFEKHFPTKIVWLLSAFFFGMPHVISQPLYMGFFVSLMGLYFGWLYMKTRSLIFPIIAHTVANIISVCVVIRS